MLSKHGQPLRRFCGPENAVGHLTGLSHQLPKAKAESIKLELEQHPDVSNTATFESILGLD